MKNLKDAPLYLGIDVSTQSLTLTLARIVPSAYTVEYEYTVSYTEESLRNRYSIDKDTKILSEESIKNFEAGEAMQPPMMFLDALDMGLTHIAGRVQMTRIKSIAVSTQQHGHVYLNKNADEAFECMRNVESGAVLYPLASYFRYSFSFPHAPIWMMSASQIEAEEICREVGGAARMREISGAESPARFTGAVIRYIAKKHSRDFASTARIHLLSSFLSGVLVGNASNPIDWGNASGMSLMNFSQKTWNDTLLKATMKDIRAPLHLRAMLPPLASPIDCAGLLAEFFVKKYGFDKDCVVAVGSGDNPQSKVLVKDDLLSLGSSFVIMADAKNKNIANLKDVNAMYDGVGNPFVFGCRSNGAFVWDIARKKVNVAANISITSSNNTGNLGATIETGESAGAGVSFDLAAAEHALEHTKIGSKVLLWQPFEETFPRSKCFEASSAISTSEDYVALIDSTLVLLQEGASGFMERNTDRLLYVTGGPAGSRQIMQRIANIWNRPVKKLSNAGASLGAAFAAYACKMRANAQENHLTQETNVAKNKASEYSLGILQMHGNKEIIYPQVDEQLGLDEFRKKVTEMFEALS